jgi:serine/threonine protein kinase
LPDGLLGLLLYEMITGHPRIPNEKPPNEALRILMNDEAPKLSTVVHEIDPSLEQLVAEMLELRPERRPKTTSEVRERLGDMLGDDRYASPPYVAQRRRSSRLATAPARLIETRPVRRPR